MDHSFKCSTCGTRINTVAMKIGSTFRCSTCGKEHEVPKTSFMIGMVQGNYWIQKAMGAGNIGEVYVAKQLSNNDKVFLKVFSRLLASAGETVDAFIAGMRRDDPERFPNILGVEETGTLYEHAYFTTRLVEGECLDQRIERAGPMPEKDALRICWQVAKIMRACCAEEQTVHGAIKPQNILIDKDGQSYLLDFGSHKRRLVADTLSLEQMNVDGDLFDFMSPEEIESKPVTVKSDIYQLGATLYFLVTGKKPYASTDSVDIRNRHVKRHVPSASKVAEASASVTRLIRGMMGDSRGLSIGSWDNLLKALKELRSASSPERDRTTTRVVPVPQQPATPQDSSKRLLLAVGIGIGALLLIAIIAGVAMASRGADSAPTTPSRGGPAPNDNTAAPIHQPRSGRPLFRDTFRKSTPNWQILSGRWQMKSGVMACGGSDNVPVIAAGDPSWQDYAVECQVRIGEGTGMGVIGRAQDGRNFYALRINVANQTVALWRVQDGNWASLGSSPFRSSRGEWYIVRLDMRGNQLSAYVGNKPYLSVTDTAYSQGIAGLHAAKQSKANFDNFRILP